MIDQYPPVFAIIVEHFRPLSLTIMCLPVSHWKWHFGWSGRGAQPVLQDPNWCASTAFDFTKQNCFCVVMVFMFECQRVAVSLRTCLRSCSLILLGQIAGFGENVCSKSRHFWGSHTLLLSTRGLGKEYLEFPWQKMVQWLLRVVVGTSSRALKVCRLGVTSGCECDNATHMQRYLWWSIQQAWRSSILLLPIDMFFLPACLTKFDSHGLVTSISQYWLNRQWYLSRSRTQAYRIAC